MVLNFFTLPLPLHFFSEDETASSPVFVFCLHKGLVLSSPPATERSTVYVLSVPAVVLRSQEAELALRRRRQCRETAAATASVSSSKFPCPPSTHSRNPFSRLSNTSNDFQTLTTGKTAMVDSRRRSWLRRKRGKRQCNESSSSSLAMLLLLLLVVAPSARAQPFTINSSTNEVSHIPWINEDAVVANQVRGGLN